MLLLPLLVDDLHCSAAAHGAYAHCGCRTEKTLPGALWKSELQAASCKPFVLSLSLSFESRSSVSCFICFRCCRRRIRILAFALAMQSQKSFTLLFSRPVEVAGGLGVTKAGGMWAVPGSIV